MSRPAADEGDGGGNVEVEGVHRRGSLSPQEQRRVSLRAREEAIRALVEGSRPAVPSRKQQQSSQSPAGMSRAMARVMAGLLPVEPFFPEHSRELPRAALKDGEYGGEDVRQRFDQFPRDDLEVTPPEVFGCPGDVASPAFTVSSR